MQLKKILNNPHNIGHDVSQSAFSLKMLPELPTAGLGQTNIPPGYLVGGMTSAGLMVTGLIALMIMYKK